MTCRREPPIVTVEFDRKLCPMIDTAGGVAPTTTADGVMLVISGAGLDEVPEVTMKTDEEVPPPGPGFRTATEKVPAVERSDVERSNVNVPLSTCLNERFALLANTVQFSRNELPLIVTVGGLPPTGADDGASEMILGTGLLGIPEPARISTTADSTALAECCNS